MTDIDTRIAEILDSVAGTGFSVMVARDDLDWLISQLREHRIEHTLVECSQCGRGYRVRETGHVGEDRICVDCMGSVVTRYQGILSEIVIDAEGWEVGEDNFVHSDLIERAKVALKGAGDE